MVRTKSLYERCHELFAEYPLAVEPIDESGLIMCMALLLADGDETLFFMLVGDYTEGTPAFSLFPWNADGGTDVGPGDVAVADAYAAALTFGTPVPRDGSLFGWVDQQAVTALMSVQTERTPTNPVPSWAVMPLVGSPAAIWPPFTRDYLLGPWFWEYYRTGEIASLDGLIAGTSGLVFWVETTDTLGSGCYTVTQDLQNKASYTLRRGRYVYYQVLLEGKLVPSLAELLTSPGKIDLGPRFQLPGQPGTGPPDQAAPTGLEGQCLNQR